ncbi:hypothetical protein Tco_0473949 [Tanacetum coccineum]
MDNPNITMEEYIGLEEEKARRYGKVYNWETATYGKIWYDDDIHDLRSIETEFPAIVFNDELTSEKARSCEPTVSSLNNNEIDFRISFDESDDEDYMPTVSYFDDLDILKYFENEFLAIVYNDALTSKSDSSTEPVKIPHRIDEFDLKTKTSLSECDEKEQNVVCFNDLFPFNIIYPDDLDSDKDNDDNEIDIYNLRGVMMLFNLIKNLYVSFGISFDPKRYYKDGDYTSMLRRPRSLYGVSIYMAPLPPREQRHPFFRYQGLEYYDRDIADFKERLERIHVKGTHRVQVLDFEGMPEPMRDVLYARMLIEHLDDDRVVLGGARRHMSWRKFILALGLHTGEEMESPDFARAGCWIGQHPLLVGPISEEIYVKLGDTWAWVPIGPARQEGDAGGVAEEAFGGTTRTGATYTRYSESPVEYQRHSVRQRTDEPSTSAAPQQHDP